LAIAITIPPTSIVKIEPSYAQPTFDTPSGPDSAPNTDSPTETGTTDDEEDFQQFMECLFGGQASEEDISSALEGNSESTPTEQEIRDCFAPLYNTGSATDTTTTSEGGTSDETDDGTSDNEGESED
jgi:hypothetical protein